MSDLQIISKGIYRGENNGAFPIEVKEYIFARNKGKKCLLLRFSTSSDIKFTEIHFWLIQKNSYGEKIRRRLITLKNVYCTEGKVVSPTNSFTIDDTCVDFEVKIVSAFVGAFEYKCQNGESVVKYPINSTKNLEIKRKESCAQRSKLNGKVKYTVLILIFAIFLIAFAIIWPFFKEDVCPVIKNALSAGWDFLVKAFKSFLKMIGELSTSLFDSKKA